MLPSTLFFFFLEICLRPDLYIQSGVSPVHLTGHHRRDCGGHSCKSTFITYISLHFLLVFFYANIYHLLLQWKKKKLIIEESYCVNHRKLGINCSGCHWLAALGHLVSKHFVTKAVEFFSLCCSPSGSVLVVFTGRTVGQQ